MLTLELMRHLWPNGNKKVSGLIEGIVATAPAVFAKYGFDSDLVIAHAMAQFSHECGAGLEMVENTNYSASRACAVWPNRFHSETDCYAKVDSFPGDPQFHTKLIDHVYGGRMGNAPYPSHDGSNNIGRGFSQITGHDGYLAVKNKTGIDLIAHPEYASDPRYALECGVADFVICGCLPYAQKDDLLGVSSMLNVGHYVSDPAKVVGYNERKIWLAHLKKDLADPQFRSAQAAPPIVSAVTPAPTPVSVLVHTPDLVLPPTPTIAPDAPPSPKKAEGFWDYIAQHLKP
jgi:putative chitinase